MKTLLRISTENHPDESSSRGQQSVTQAQNRGSQGGIDPEEFCKSETSRQASIVVLSLRKNIWCFVANEAEMDKKTRSCSSGAVEWTPSLRSA